MLFTKLLTEVTGGSMASDINDIKTFSQSGLNTDSDLLAIQGGDSRYRLNVILSEDGNYEVLSNVNGNVLRNFTLPSGTNRVIGFVEDKENDAGIYFIRNLSGGHSIIRYNSSDNTFTNIIYDESELDLTNIDFVDAGIIGNEEEQALIWCDGVNPPRMININKAITGGYAYYNDDVFLFYRKPLIAVFNSITTAYSELIPRSPNIKLSNKIFQFAVRLLYFDNTFSTLSHYSEISFPEENIPSGKLSNDIGYDYIRVTVDIQNEPEVVTAYQLLYRIVDTGGGSAGSWEIYDEYEYTAKGTDLLEFYNDKSQGEVSDTEAARPFDYVPDVSSHVEIIDSNRAVLDVKQEGYDNVDIDVSTSVVETAIPAINEGVVQSNDDTLISGGPSIVYTLSLSASDDYYYLLAIDGNFYFLYTYNRAGIDVYTDFKSHFDSLSISGLTISVTASSITLTLAAAISNIAVGNLVLTKTPYFRTLKTGASYKFGIEYGYNGKRGSVQTNDQCIIQVPDFADVSSTYTNYYLRANITLNHTPPTGATDFRIVSFGSSVNYFEEYLVSFDIGGLSDSSFVTMYLDEPYTVIKKTEIINRMRKAYGDEDSGIDYGFDFQVGDIIKFVGYFDVVPTADSALYDVVLVGDLEYRIDVVTTDEIKITSSAIRAVRDKSLALPYWLIQIIRNNETFNALAEEFSLSYDISVHASPIEVTRYFSDTWKSKQVFINSNNGSDYGIVINSYDWMEKPKISLFYDSRPLSQGRVNAVNPFAVQRQANKIQWGGQWIDDAGINFLTKFDFDDQRDLDDRNGIITKIQQIGDVLKVYQERKITSFYLKTTSSTDADGNQTYVFDRSVMSEGRQSIDDYGCTHFSSYVKNVRNAYFFDIIHGCVVRDSANGFQEISQNLMHTYFKQKSREILASVSTITILGGWDEDLEMYLISFVNLANLSDSINETLGFHEPSNRWISFYSFYPEYYGKISGDQLLSFRAGSLYEHNVNSLRNNFYGDQYTSEVWLHSTEQAVLNKVFNSLEINSVNQWSCPDEDSITIERPIVMQSRLLPGKFRLQEGVYRANFLRDALNGGSVFNRLNLLNGRQLRGKEITTKLKNSDTSKSLLESVLINSSISK